MTGNILYILTLEIFFSVLKHIFIGSNACFSFMDFLDVLKLVVGVGSGRRPVRQLQMVVQYITTFCFVRACVATPRVTGGLLGASLNGCKFWRVKLCTTNFCEHLKNSKKIQLILSNIKLTIVNKFFKYVLIISCGVTCEKIEKRSLWSVEKGTKEDERY